MQNNNKDLNSVFSLCHTLLLSHHYLYIIDFYKKFPILYQRLRFLFIGCFLALLSGCALFHSHDRLMSSVIEIRQTQGTEAAISKLQGALSKSRQNNLLYLMEAGELLRENQQYEASTQLWLQADQQVQAWEQASLFNLKRVMGYIGASTISERLKPYEGQDYEKTWLSTRISLNHLALDDWGKARADIKRTHEREQVIADIRAAEIAKVREQAQQNGWDIDGKTLDGYPVEYINAPEVLEIQNSYQNAFSHYLAGFLYEALNEPSLAAPGYRKAIELRPNTPLLETGLKEMEARLSNANNTSATQTDVLFIIETGNAPVRTSYETRFFIPTNDGTIFTQLAFPVIIPTPPPTPGMLKAGPYQLEIQPIVDLNAMARRALHDEMPGLVMRAALRAFSKGSLQAYANSDKSDSDGKTNTAKAILDIAIFLYSVIPEFADDRVWRTLPGAVSIARGYLPPGDYPLTINGTDTEQIIHIEGQYALVPIRLICSNNNTCTSKYLVGHVSHYGQQSTKSRHFEESIP